MSDAGDKMRGFPPARCITPPRFVIPHVLPICTRVELIHKWSVLQHICLDLFGAVLGSGTDSATRSLMTSPAPTPPHVRLLDLCSGAGMLGLAVDLMLREVLGWDVRPIAYCEIADYPREILNARMRDGTLHRAPILRDVTRLPMSDLLGRVDLICAGFPCPPVSVAGKGLGEDDERWLWPHVRDACRDLRPTLVFLENVPGLVTANDGRELRSVAADLAAIGFDAEWGCLGSGDVGANHGRARWWCLGYHPGVCLADPDGESRGSKQVGESRSEDPAEYRDGGARLRAGDVADSHSVRQRQQEGGVEELWGRPWHSGSELGGRKLANPDGQGLEERPDVRGDGGEEQPTPQRSGRSLGSLYAWGPLDPRWDDGGGDWAAFPVLRRVAHGVASRVERVKALGNGVDPLAAAVAYALLGERLGLWRLR